MNGGEMAEKSGGEICSFTSKWEDDYVCGQEIYKDKFCIFHHPEVEGKETEFNKTLDKYIEEVEKQDKPEYKFIGFVFPKVSFKGKIFSGSADFCGSQFSGDANFRESQFSGYAKFEFCQFSGEANFYNSQFCGYANFMYSQFSRKGDFMESQFSRTVAFSGSQFSSEAYFISSQFSEIAYFSAVQFSENAEFFKSQFSGYAKFFKSQFFGDAKFMESQFSGKADFMESQFSGKADFRESQFTGKADFRESQFTGEADFSGSQFLQRAEFNSVEFHGEVLINEAYMNFLKNMDSPKNGQGISFEGTVLEETHFWGINRLEGYSFRNAFLLSLNLAKREIINCDFTGAVIGAVHTQGWKPDKATLDNTKYIYTEYTVEEEVDEEGKTLQACKPVETSRVPARENFGEGYSKDFTLADYLKEPFKWSFAINLPGSIRSGIISYLQFFSEFMSVTHDTKVEIMTRQEGGAVRVEFMADTEEIKQEIKSVFEEYMNNATKDFDDLHFDFKVKGISETELRLFKMEYEEHIYRFKKALEKKELLLDIEKDRRKEILWMVERLTQNPAQLLQPTGGTTIGNNAAVTFSYGNNATIQTVTNIEASQSLKDLIALINDSDLPEKQKSIEAAETLQGMVEDKDNPDLREDIKKNIDILNGTIKLGEGLSKHIPTALNAIINFFT